MYPDDYRLRPARVDRELDDGDQVELDDALLMTVVSTPGHSRGHLSFLLEDSDAPAKVRILFSGDALFPGGRILLQDTWDCDLGAALRSVEKLVALRPDQLFGGHLAPQLRAVPESITAAVERIGRLLPPENLL
jgi:glyoxylase-like metal-dependent hydrolase (beta-lactamase superfamily II)